MLMVPWLLRLRRRGLGEQRGGANNSERIIVHHGADMGATAAIFVPTGLCIAVVVVIVINGTSSAAD